MHWVSLKYIPVFHQILYVYVSCGGEKQQETLALQAPDANFIIKDGHQSAILFLINLKFGMLLSFN